jgi:hypothetical protein
MAESRFTEILTASSEHLLKVLYQAASQPGEPGADAGRRSEMTAKALGIRHGQLICAIGFNRHIDTLPDVLGLLGFASAADIYRLRDRIFTQDVYRHLRLREILAIYHQMALDHPPQAAMQRGISKSRSAPIASNAIAPSCARFTQSLLSASNSLKSASRARTAAFAPSPTKSSSSRNRA